MSCAVQLLTMWKVRKDDCRHKAMHDGGAIAAVVHALFQRAPARELPRALMLARCRLPHALQMHCAAWKTLKSPVSWWLIRRARDRRFPQLCMAPEGTCSDGRCLLQVIHPTCLPVH